MVRSQGKVKGKESLFLMQSAMCNSPSALCPADMPKHQKDVYGESPFICEHFWPHFNSVKETLAKRSLLHEKQNKLEL